ncbi:MAG TPA: hypothetical protein VJ140_05045 [Actinomycetota bacterium]|nr:hypothetical protein [Actinomycetota bacterium]
MTRSLLSALAVLAAFVGVNVSACEPAPVPPAPTTTTTTPPVEPPLVGLTARAIRTPEPLPHQDGHEEQPHRQDP